jgi:hypothetical protein
MQLSRTPGYTSAKRKLNVRGKGKRICGFFFRFLDLLLVLFHAELSKVDSSCL